MTNLINEISAMESELEGLRSENQMQGKHIAVLEFENDQLRKALNHAKGERDNFMRRSDKIKSLLNATGAALVTGIQEFHNSERERQEEQLGVGTGDKPKFLSTAERTFN